MTRSKNQYFINIFFFELDMHMQMLPVYVSYQWTCDAPAFVFVSFSVG